MSGATSIVSSGAPVQEVFAAARALLALSQPRFREQIHFQGFSLLPSRLVVRVDGTERRLGPGQMRSLLLLIEKQGQVVSHKQLRRSFGSVGDSRAVRKHMEHLRRSLGSQGGMIKTVYKAGYVFEPTSGG